MAEAAETEADRPEIALRAQFQQATQRQRPHFQMLKEPKKTYCSRPPNKKKFDEQLDEILAQIKDKEASLKNLNIRHDGAPRYDLKTIRSEKEIMVNQRRIADDSLRNISKEITIKNAALTKVQSNLQYKKEERINHAIYDLEVELKTINFSLNEEKKIVAEIDSLKRSKKALGQYQELKREIDELRSRQRVLREERDGCFKNVATLRQREEDVKTTCQQNKVLAESTKREIDELYERKRMLVSEFKSMEKDWLIYRDEQKKKQRKEYMRKKEEERRILAEEYEEYEASREPYEDERLMCRSLISYLHSFKATDSNTESQDPTSSAPESVSIPNVEGMYLLRKKNSDDLSWMMGKATNKMRKSRKDRRKTLNKPITHTAQIFAQFAELGLTAPSNVTEVKSSIALLEEKLNEFGCKQLSNLVGRQDYEAEGSAGAPSFTESVISESIPTTPDVQLDQPNFPSLLSAEPRRRKLSHDSGTCELEEIGNPDDDLQDLCLNVPDNVIHMTQEACEIKTEVS